MTDGPRDFEGEDDQTKDLAPENDNSEQDDASAQANTVADQASGRGSDDFGLGDTVKPKGGIEDEDDQQDLVDHMEQMVSSGMIDNSAFRGEPNYDDEDGLLGPGGEEDDTVSDEDRDLDLEEDDDDEDEDEE
jgi:hypothetical protein